MHLPENRTNTRRTPKVEKPIQENKNGKKDNKIFNIQRDKGKVMMKNHTKMIANDLKHAYAIKNMIINKVRKMKI